MKPDIVFFGEQLPPQFELLFTQDMQTVDLLIVMGSSLKVAPVADVIHRIPANVPQILINREALPHMDSFDIQLLGYSDGIVAELERLLGWNKSDDDKELDPKCTAGDWPHVKYGLIFSNGYLRVRACQWNP